MFQFQNWPLSRRHAEKSSIATFLKLEHPTPEQRTFPHKNKPEFAVDSES